MLRTLGLGTLTTIFMPGTLANRLVRAHQTPQVEGSQYALQINGVNAVYLGGNAFLSAAHCGTPKGAQDQVLIKGVGGAPADIVLFRLPQFSIFPLPAIPLLNDTPKKVKAIYVVHPIQGPIHLRTTLRRQPIAPINTTYRSPGILFSEIGTPTVGPGWSGSPVFIQTENTFFLIGIASMIARPKSMDDAKIALGIPVGEHLEQIVAAVDCTIPYLSRHIDSYRSARTGRGEIAEEDLAKDPRNRSLLERSARFIKNIVARGE